MSSEQIFANGRIAVLSNKLFGKDKYMRLAESGSLAEALKILSELGYAAADSSDYERVLREELDKTLGEVKELCCSRNALGFLLCKYDCHNAKTLMKGKYMREDLVSYCFTNATFAPERMRDDFNSDNYGGYPKNIAEACDAADAEFANGNRSPQVIDKLLDNAYIAELRRFAKASASRLLSKLCDLQIDFVNLTLVARLKKAGAPRETLREWFAFGGSVKLDSCEKLFDGDVGVLPEAYRKLYGKEESELVFARMRRNVIDEFADPLTIQPAIGYFYDKLCETEMVRRILADVKRGADKEKIKEKINAYA